MAKKEIAVKKYVVELSAEERDRLEAMVRAGKNSAQILTRARILLKADVSEAGDGWSDCAISAALDTSINNVARTRQQLVEEGFEATLKRKYDGVEAKVCAGPDGSETFLLVRSAERQQKEQAMHARFCERIETALASLQRRIERAQKPIDRGAAERQIGRLLGRNSRAAARYAVRLVDDQILPAGLRLEWSRRAEWDDWSRHSEGCYVLRTNLRDWSSEALWRTYIQLSEAEAAFRINKSELSIRPIWHQREDRVLAHILVCFLAYVLWKTLEQWQSRAGLGNSPRTLLQELAAITSTDVILPTAAPPGRELRLRCVVRPDRAQAVLLERLGLRLPERLRMPRAARTM